KRAGEFSTSASRRIVALPGVTLLDISGAPPDCSAYQCGWAFLGAQITMTSDAAGTLYALWNAGSTDKGPARIYFASSTSGGAIWPPGVDVSKAAWGVEHAFPAVTAGSAGDVRIAWMDARNSPLWNVYYRSSTNAARPGQASPSSPATWRVTATFNPMALVFRSEIILKWTLIAAATHRSFGVKG